MPNNASGSPAATNKTQDELATLKEDMRRLKDDMDAMLSNAGDRARLQARELRDNVQDSMESTLRDAEHYIGTRPFTSVLVALGVGLVLGKIISFK